MKTVLYSCNGPECRQKREEIEPSEWLSISGGDIGLKIRNGLDGRRLIELSSHNTIHFCSRGCFENYFFKNERSRHAACLGNDSDIE
jgi:hypothetical protein